MKIVINSDYGGYGLSEKAVLRYLELKKIPVWVESHTRYAKLGINTYWLVPPENRLKSHEEDWNSLSLEERKEYNRLYAEQTFDEDKIERNDPLLVQVVEELGDEANSRYSSLKVVEIPDDVKWHINEYDGWESIHEDHRVWE